MYNIILHDIENTMEYNDLIKVFLSPDQYEINGESDVNVIHINQSCSKEKNEILREILTKLRDLTGQTPYWGVLTGVRPVKLVGELTNNLGTNEAVKAYLKDHYCISDEKTDLIMEIYGYQQQHLGSPRRNSAGMYIGIPFCPTRCLYCSFTSNQKPKSEIDKYLVSLNKEIQYVGRRMEDTGMYPESVYIGGGTPTTLDEFQLDNLLNEIEHNIDLCQTMEFTVEAGRPDTITDEKLKVLKNHGIDRISINPQSMNSHTLELIGRSHSPEDILRAFELSDKHGFSVVNCDLIAGLPEESPDDFKRTLDIITGLGPSNITVHTLAVKKASRLIEANPNYHYKQAETVREMLKLANDSLRALKYKPYYLYRQKNMSGAFENVGWCKDDTPCIYNIRIMEEKQHILALGAGGVSKIFFADENRLERVPNVSNYEVYNERIDQMLNRKESGFFGQLTI